MLIRIVTTVTYTTAVCSLAYSVTPTNGSWYSVTAAISSDGTGSEAGELVTFGWIGEHDAGGVECLCSCVLRSQMQSSRTGHARAWLCATP